MIIVPIIRIIMAIIRKQTAANQPQPTLAANPSFGTPRRTRNR